MELPKRKKMRIKGFDYSQNGSYFITICTFNRKMVFGKIIDYMMILNEYGLMIKTNIQKLNCLYDGTSIDKYVIMPNHIHMIITICRERIACVPNDDPTKSQLSKMIQIFKSSITKAIRNRKRERNACNAFPTGIWQAHFYDHIIRNEDEYQKIWQYIDENQLKWEDDCYYIK